MSSITVWAAEYPGPYSSDNPVTVVIDPGHGGENLGAEWEDYTEKDMTLIVAEAMKEELEKYEGVNVYLTRTDDVDMDLEDRINFAKDMGADFFFCLHFNMSVNHDLYGAENWVSAFGSNYARGNDFAQIEMGLLTDLGLYDRGIKTRLNKKGTNYYGILRLGDEAEIPSVIIEHCHLDNINDTPFYDHKDMLLQYGELDATAAAMYFRLYSSQLNKDFRDYEYPLTQIPDKRVDPDFTEPLFCKVSVLDRPDNASMRISITSQDPECRMLYYSVSYDGGNTFSERYPWRGENGENGDTITTTIDIPYDKDIRLVINAINLYDLITPSEVQVISRLEKPEIPEVNSKNQEKITDTKSQEYETIDRYADSDAGENGQSDISTYDRPLVILIICLSVAALVVVIIGVNLFMRNNRRHKRRKREKN